MTRNAISWIGKLVALACFYFIYRTFSAIDWSHTAITDKSGLLRTASLATLLHILLLFVVAFGWKIILEFVSGKPVAFRAIVPVHFKASVAKYLPGNIFEFVARNVLAAKFGISQSSIFLASLLEAFLGVANFLLLLLIFWLFGLIHPPTSLLNKINPLSLVFILGLGVFLLFFLRTEVRKNYVDFKNAGVHLTASALLRFSSLNAFILLCSSALFILIFHQLDPLIFEKLGYFELTGIYLVAYFAGYLVPGAPGGLGVRESLLVLFLGGTYPEEYILLAAFTLRAVNIIGDVAGYPLAMAFEKKK